MQAVKPSATLQPRAPPVRRRRASSGRMDATRGAVAAMDGSARTGRAGSRRFSSRYAASTVAGGTPVGAPGCDPPPSGSSARYLCCGGLIQMASPPQPQRTPRNLARAVRCARAVKDAWHGIGRHASMRCVRAGGTSQRSPGCPEQASRPGAARRGSATAPRHIRSALGVWGLGWGAPRKRAGHR